MFASPVTNKCETLYQQASDQRCSFLLTLAAICAAALKGVLCGERCVRWAKCCRRDFLEGELREAADAGIATISGGICLKITHPHFVDLSCAIENLTSIIYISKKSLGFLIFVIELISRVVNGSCATHFLDVARLVLYLFMLTTCVTHALAYRKPMQRAVRFT
jgi:hypothetical protein